VSQFHLGVLIDQANLNCANAFNPYVPFQFHSDSTKQTNGNQAKDYSMVKAFQFHSGSTKPLNRYRPMVHPLGTAGPVSIPLWFD
jgi:hypothetical protein